MAEKPDPRDVRNAINQPIPLLGAGGWFAAAVAPGIIP